MPVGDSPAPQPGETVKDQLMRTFTAVRTRLRAGHSGGSDGDEPAAAGDSVGNGSHTEQPLGTMEPVDPLLAGKARRGDGNGDEAATEPDDVAVTEPGPAADFGEVPADTIVAPPDEVAPAEAPLIEAVPLTLPATEPVSEGPMVESEPPPAAPRAARARRRRARPALPLLRRRPRVRKVTRIVRRVDAWGVFKISVIFYVILYIILLVAGVLLWNLANTTGTVANVEGFIRDLFGLKTFEFDGEKLFRASWVLGAILVVAGTGFNVTMAILFNLISDLVGGVRVTVLEEEVVLRERPVLPPRAADETSAPEAESFPEALAPPTAVVPAGAVEVPAEEEVPDDAPPVEDPLPEPPPRRTRPMQSRRTPETVAVRPPNGRVRSEERTVEPVAPTDPEGG